jgi:hypothetical protein
MSGSGKPKRGGMGSQFGGIINQSLYFLLFVFYRYD